MSYYRTRRPRRSRYTVLLAGKQPQVILAPSADDARYFYAKRGETVVKISKGDYRTKAKAREAKRQGGFRIDDAAVKRACEYLGLKLPVRIRLHSRYGGTNGNYGFEGTYHNVMLKSYRTPEQADVTLWHELTHALQCERDGKADKAAWAEISNAQRNYCYQRRPIEIEARAMAAKMAPIFPLTIR